ncbi:MAG: ATP-binding protein [Clostridia bacterium]|nr:ATP-binding protein [Clostridia bacterium]
MKYISRTIEEKLISMIDSYQVIMITGPRQVGKSTLLSYISRKLNKKINKVTLDDLVLKKQAQEDPELFLRTHEAPLIIDEFQRAPELLSYIKIIVDDENEKVTFGEKDKIQTLYFLTGSQIFETMEEISESLAGRVGILDLYGLSEREIEGKESQLFIPNISDIKTRKRTEYKSTLELYKKIYKGSYPELYTINKDIEKYYSGYFRTFIEKDLRKLINIKDENKFIKFVSSLAARTGQEFIATSVASEIGIDDKTASSWLSILKNTGIIYLLQPYMNNRVGKIIKREKIYFTDTGLACYLSGYIDHITLEKSAYSGAIFETYVVDEIIKSFANSGKDIKKHLCYYRDNNHKEIDLLINYNNVIYPIEIKKSANPSRDAIKNFDVVGNFETQKGNGIVLCMSKDIIAYDESNYMVPIEYI